MVAFVSILCCVLVGTGLSFAQHQDDTPPRKVVIQKAVPYPPLAQRTRTSGTVRLEAIVATNGEVKRVQVVGGNPVLAQAALNSVSKWKWEPSAHETRESVELRFLPQ
jgi:TonB family protein